MASSHPKSCRKFMNTNMPYNYKCITQEYQNIRLPITTSYIGNEKITFTLANIKVRYARSSNRGTLSAVGLTLEKTSEFSPLDPSLLASNFEQHWRLHRRSIAWRVNRVKEKINTCKRWLVKLQLYEIWKNVRVIQKLTNTIHCT